MGPHQGERRRQSTSRRPDPHPTLQRCSRSSSRDPILSGSGLLQARGLHGSSAVRRCTLGPRADESAGKPTSSRDRGQVEPRGIHGVSNSLGSGCRRSCGPGSCHAAQKVNAVQQIWRSLPKNGKPRIRPNGQKEWTVVAGILVDGKVVAVASGVKSVQRQPTTGVGTGVGSKVGSVIADMHAEILVLRALSRYIYDNKITKPGEIELVVSHTPCGDASMSAINWDHDTLFEVAPGLVKGRSGPHLLGVLRTKPGRADSPTTLSKSCSDKLALRQINGCLASWAGCQAYISQLYTPTTPDFERCFGRWNDRIVVPITWHDTTNLEWPEAKGDVPCTTSVVWTAAGFVHPGRLEILCNGIRQGSKRGTKASISVFAPPVDTPQNSRKWYPDGWVRTYNSSPV